MTAATAVPVANEAAGGHVWSATKSIIFFVSNAGQINFHQGRGTQYTYPLHGS